ncbi:MAG: hypothetical protein JO174_03675 [Herbaspirillum sp.]|nr:hypothetical protein [Herbaspirillum sp.]
MLDELPLAPITIGGVAEKPPPLSVVGRSDPGTLAPPVCASPLLVAPHRIVLAGAIANADADALRIVVCPVLDIALGQSRCAQAILAIDHRLVRAGNCCLPMLTPKLPPQKIPLVPSLRRKVLSTLSLAATMLTLFPAPMVVPAVDATMLPVTLTFLLYISHLAVNAPAMVKRLSTASLSTPLQ